LTVDAWERSDGLALQVSYNADLFEPETVARMAGHLETLLSGGVADPERAISTLPLLTTPERQWLVKDRNATRTDYPRDRRIHELFEVQAGQTPEAIALVHDATQWTYDELNRKANRLAHSLRRLGVGRGVLVGVFMQRSPEMVMALLAILKAGGAYVPLDLSSPADRIDSMLRDAAAPVVITQSALLDRCATRAARTVCLDSAHDATLEAEPEANPGVSGDPLDLAYVMYTSGSTGQPKGVAVPHRGVVRLVKNTNYARLASDEVFLQLAPVSFDASTLEIWGSLLNGARLVLFPGQVPSLDELAEILSRNQVTILWLTAGLFHHVVEERLDALRPVRQLLAGGDVLSAPHVRRTLQSLPGVRLINGYGPTENTTFTCCHPMTDPAQVPDSVPIGRPIANTTVYILDRQMQPVPVGVRGELWTGGDGLAAGYFNRPELTAERFVADPFGNARTDRLYRTGDFARYLPDGTIQFLGRMDDQVKIRGFRIELGEIEASLLRHPAVRQAVVIVRDEPLAGRQLVAYLVADGLERTGPRDLRAFLKAILPDYMIPAVFVWLDRLPLTPNGKVDRRALPSPATEATGEHPEAAASPWNELELRLARLWEETLGVKRVGRRDNFFDLGGHSLLAARLFARMEKEFGRKLPLSVLFTAPTVEQLAVLIRQEGWAPSWRTLVPIQPQGSRPPIFAVPGVGGNVVGYAPLADLLGSDQPLYGLQARGLDGEEAPLTTFEEMAAHHLAEIRAVQPKGPYHLVGLCIGGVIAYEMAQQLVRAGEEVGMLAMLETWPPPPVRRIRASARLDRALAFFWLLLDRLKQYSITLARLPMNERWEFLVSRVSVLRSMLVHRNPFGEAQNEVSQTLVERANVRALDHYTVRPYPGRILYVLAEGRRVPFGLDTRGVWRRSAVGGYEHFTLPTEDSGHMLNEPHVRVLAARLAEYLQRVTASRATAEHQGP